MLTLKLAQETLLKNALEALDDLFSEANFDFSNKGLELQARDTRGIALVVLLLRPEAFSKYCCDRDFYMGLNLADMAKVLRCMSDRGLNLVTITAEDVINCCDTVIFTFASKEVDASLSFKFDFEGVNNVPYEITEFPESDYKAIVCMHSAKFLSICKLLSSIGDRGDVVITVDEEQVDFVTWGKPGGSTIICKRTQTDEPKECTLIKVKEKVSLIFELRYIDSFSKVSTLSDQVTIRLSSKLPAMFEYKVAEGYIRYYLLARNEKEDEMQNEGDEMQRIAKEDKMQNEGYEMQN